MPLNSSGPISMGGSTTGQSINLELGKSATAQISLNDSDARSLAGVPSGQNSLSNFYGKSSLTTVVFTTVGATNWTVPSGVTSIRVTVVGGGGGGSAGAIPGGGTGGGGGGAGGAASGSMSVTPGDIATIVVGTQGGRNGAAGMPGGSSSLEIGSNRISGLGGTEGQPSTNSSGGPGGSYSTVGIWSNVSFSNGSSGENGTATYGGAGGTRIAFHGISGSGGPRDTVNGGDATSATGYGAGSGGTYGISDSQGASTSGIVRIEYGSGI